MIEPTNSVQTFEYLVIGCLILLQIYIAIKLYYRITIYKSTFNKMPSIEMKEVSIGLYNGGNVSEILIEDTEDKSEETTQISFLKNTSTNKVLSNISTAINSYLIKNKGASIDYHILKDITDRYIEIVEEEINNQIPAPLYIGLAATMLGIILGLFAINFDIDAESSTLALEAIQPLIEGVKIAMTASVVGLTITTIFSVGLYKKAKSVVEEGKNQFLSLLQSDLLPKMNKSKLPEVHILSTKLDAFARNTTGVISQLDGIVKISSEAVFREQKLISEIKDLDVTKVAAVNIDVFNQLEGMMGSFQNFAKYYEKLDKSLLNTTKLLQSLESFVTNTHNINIVLEEIKSNISRSDQATNFFNTHIQSFSDYGNAVNEAVANTDSKMSKAITELSESAHKQFEAYNMAIADYDSKMSKAFEKSIVGFSEIMTNQINKTDEAYNGSRPKFEKLNKLDKLEVIEDRLLGLEQELCNVISIGNSNIIRALESMGAANTPLPSSDFSKTERKKNPLNSLIIGLKLTTYLVIIISGFYFLYLNI